MLLTRAEEDTGGDHRGTPFSECALIHILQQINEMPMLHTQTYIGFNLESWASPLLYSILLVHMVLSTIVDFKLFCLTSIFPPFEYKPTALQRTLFATFSP